MSNKFVNLYTESSGITDVMAGPWRDIRVDTIDVGTTLELESTSAEHSCFVIEGEAELLNGDGQSFNLTAQSAFSLPSGGRATVTATSPTRLLHIEMTLPQ